MNFQIPPVDLIGYIGSFIVMIAFLPQAIKIWKTKSVEDISIQTYILLIFSTIIWTLYGYLKSDNPLIITNVSLFCIQGSIIICKLKYRKKFKN